MNATQAGDAFGEVFKFMLSQLPKARAQEITSAVAAKRGVLETVMTMRSFTAFEMRLEYHSGKRNVVLYRLPVNLDVKA